MKVVLSPLARLDILAAEARLEQEHPGYGDAFAEHFASAVTAIESRSRFYFRTEDGPEDVETREYYIARFEYRVIFAFPDEDTAEIIAVVHARRRPSSWVNRLSSVE